MENTPQRLSELIILINGIHTHECIHMQVLDYLAIAVHELANISERRQERMMNSCMFLNTYNL